MYSNKYNWAQWIIVLAIAACLAKTIAGEWWFIFLAATLGALLLGIREYLKAIDELYMNL